MSNCPTASIDTNWMRGFAQNTARGSMRKTSRHQTTNNDTDQIFARIWSSNRAGPLADQLCEQEDLSMSTADADHTDDTVLDRTAIDRDIVVGARAYQALLKNADLDWSHWSATIVGLRGLHALACEKAGTSSMTSQAFRDAMRSLLQLRKYAVYDLIPKQTRSECYRLMERLEDIDGWYAQLPADDKLRWKHPASVAKHCPKQFLRGGMRRHNQPPKVGKKPAVSFETERLKALLIQVIKRLAKYEPDAIDLLDQLHLPADPEDRVDDIFGESGEEC